MGDYVIRPFESIHDHEQCQELQGRIWGESFAVPVNMTVAVERHGGVAIGAFDTSSQAMIGFVLSFVAPTPYPEARHGLSQHSHMAAIDERWQGRGIGTALKLAQRDAALAQGINLMTWTYDPLEARNAALNIRKLGCICRIYERNVYGDMADNLNAGLPTDRFEVEWWLDEQRPRPADDGLSTEIAIPADFQAIKRIDMQQALEWRLRTREQFERAFTDGYVVTGFGVDNNSARYRLTRLSANLV
ncbi:MAG: hypothetical protein M1434_13870 [Chloroflexi bacterium]|nr:hypothetical protein [Chloroflexota bacterium]